MQTQSIMHSIGPDPERESSVVQFTFLSASGPPPLLPRVSDTPTSLARGHALDSLVQAFYTLLGNVSGLQEVLLHRSRSMALPHIIVEERWNAIHNLEQARTHLKLREVFTALTITPLPYPLGPYFVPPLQAGGQVTSESGAVSSIPGLAAAVEWMIPPFFADILSEEEIEVLGLVQGAKRRAIVAHLFAAY